MCMCRGRGAQPAIAKNITIELQLSYLPFFVSYFYEFCVCIFQCLRLNRSTSYISYFLQLLFLFLIGLLFNGYIILPTVSSGRYMCPSTFCCPLHPMCMLSCSVSRVELFATPRTVAHQASLSIGFSRHGYWSGLPSPPPGDLPDLGIQPVSLTTSALTGRFFTASATWEAPASHILGQNVMLKGETLYLCPVYCLKHLLLFCYSIYLLADPSFHQFPTNTQIKPH